MIIPFPLNVKKFVTFRDIPKFGVLKFPMSFYE